MIKRKYDPAAMGLYKVAFDIRKPIAGAVRWVGNAVEDVADSDAVRGLVYNSPVRHVTDKLGLDPRTIAEDVNRSAHNFAYDIDKGTAAKKFGYTWLEGLHQATDLRNYHNGIADVINFPWHVAGMPQYGIKKVPTVKYFKDSYNLPTQLNRETTAAKAGIAFTAGTDAAAKAGATHVAPKVDKVVGKAKDAAVEAGKKAALPVKQPSVTIPGAKARYDMAVKRAENVRRSAWIRELDKANGASPFARDFLRSGRSNIRRYGVGDSVFSPSESIRTQTPDFARALDQRAALAEQLTYDDFINGFRFTKDSQPMSLASYQANRHPGVDFFLYKGSTENGVPLESLQSLKGVKSLGYSQYGHVPIWTTQHPAVSAGYAASSPQRRLLIQPVKNPVAKQALVDSATAHLAKPTQGAVHTAKVFRGSPRVRDLAQTQAAGRALSGTGYENVVTGREYAKLNAAYPGDVVDVVSVPSNINEYFLRDPKEALSQIFVRPSPRKFLKYPR